MFEYVWLFEMTKLKHLPTVQNKVYYYTHALKYIQFIIIDSKIYYLLAATSEKFIVSDSQSVVLFNV